ncbi:MAG: phosphomannomutase/phosphoglucomutase [Burkholderiales bacterium]|nr:phosphomannomutase/phosphoglucomutase [Burkholderiales bacterium]MBP9769121.1 phosphomannomutase/phosphoglucomutase [Burkholderiales bacterium]
MEKLVSSIFKAYDIRGIVATQLTPQTTELIGQVLGSMAIENQVKGLVVGYDGRLTSPMLAKSLINGILSTGCNVFEIGEVTTPMVYFANYELKTYSGVMITGSHNPPEYNGLKMVMAGDTLSGDKIQQIYQRIQDKQVTQGNGVHYCENILEAYFTKITSDVKLARRMSIVVDAGNGVAGKIAPQLYRRLGCKVLGLFCEVDGNFPNHHPDPSKPENLNDLIHALNSTETEIGLAFDGDGDRLGVVTKDGNIIYPDRQMMLYAADILSKNPQGKIIYDVKSSRLLADWIKENQGIPIMCRTGHSFVKAKIKETGALLAGEMSGHLFFNDRWNGSDDGVYAGARLLEILAQVEDPSELLNALPNAISTPEINIPVEFEGEQHRIIAELSQTAKFEGSQEIITIDGLRVEYPDGFGLVRASNTTPVLVLRFEAETSSALKRIMDQFRNILSSHIKTLDL